MDNEWKELSINLSHNVLELRRKRGLSQAELARRARIPRTTVTHIESGFGNPSLVNLAKLARALQVSVEELMASPRQDSRVTRRDELKKRIRGLARMTQLLPDPVPGMELDFLELAPGGWLKGSPHLEGTREYFTCLSGAMTVFVDGEAFEVASGDVVTFPGHRPHSYRTKGRGAASGVSAIVRAALKST